MPRAWQRWPKWRKDTPTCDFPPRITQTQYEKIFFSILATRFAESVEQLSSSIALRVIGLQSSARKVTHAGLKRNARNSKNLNFWVLPEYVIRDDVLKLVWVCLSWNSFFKVLFFAGWYIALAVHKVFQTFFEGHISYCTAAWGPDILRNVIEFFRYMLHSTKSTSSL